MRRPYVSRLLSFTAFAASFLSGCSTNSPIPLAPAVKGMSGAVHGGQQPISGATIQLYAVGTSGDGSASTPLLTAPVASDANGNFGITSLYTCPSSSTLVYLTATGGSPGSGTTNPQIALMAALGPCGSLTPSTFIFVNEITTVAAVYALAPYITSFSAIGSGTSDAAALALRLTYAGYIANTTTGATPGPNLPASDLVPIAQVNTIADLLGACINSPGGVSADASICGQFFALTLPAGGVTSTDTVGALLNLANNPTLNTAALFNLIPPASPFQPTQPIVPPDFSLYLISPSAFTVSPAAVAFPSAVLFFSQPTQTVAVTNATSAAVNITSASITGLNATDFALVPNPATDCAATVPANSTCTYTLSFTPTAPGSRAAYLILANSSANPTIAIALAGTGTVGAAGPVTLTPSSVSLYPPGVIYVNTPGLTLTNSGPTTLTINAITTSAAGYSQSNNCGTSLAPGASCGIYVDVTVYSVPTSATLTVLDDAAAGPQTATLNFNGGGAPNYPSVVDFGHWAIGATGGEYLQIVGPGIYGGYNFTITGPNASNFSFSSSAPANSTSCSYEYRFGTYCDLDIFYNPSTLATSTAYVNIAGFGHFTLTGTADPAGVDFDLYAVAPMGPNSTGYGAPITMLNLGSSPVGTPAATTYFTYRDTGTLPLTLNAPVLSGPNASDFTIGVPCCSTAVTFTPTGTGTRTATVTYTAGSITRTLTLVGTGY